MALQALVTDGAFGPYAPVVVALLFASRSWTFETAFLEWNASAVFVAGRAGSAVPVAARRTLFAIESCVARPFAAFLVVAPFRLV